jgi:hypothetical protein
MVKRTQSKTLDIRNREYRKFIQALRNDESEALDLGRKKRFILGNKLFLELLLKEINGVLSRNVPHIKTYQLVQLLDPENINVVEDDSTILDNVIDFFGQAVDIDDNNSAQAYFINHFYILVNKLLDIGAEIRRSPRLPQNEKFLEKLNDVLNQLDY